MSTPDPHAGSERETLADEVARWADVLEREIFNPNPNMLRDLRAAAALLAAEPPVVVPSEREPNVMAAAQELAKMDGVTTWAKLKGSAAWTYEMDARRVLAAAGVLFSEYAVGSPDRGGKDE